MGTSWSELSILTGSSSPGPTAKVFPITFQLKTFHQRCWGLKMGFLLDAKDLLYHHLLTEINPKYLHTQTFPKYVRGLSTLQIILMRGLNPKRGWEQTGSSWSRSHPAIASKTKFSVAGGRNRRPSQLDATLTWTSPPSCYKWVYSNAFLVLFYFLLIFTRKLSQESPARGS